MLFYHTSNRLPCYFLLQLVSLVLLEKIIIYIKPFHELFFLVGTKERMNLFLSYVLNIFSKYYSSFQTFIPIEYLVVTKKMRQYKAEETNT